MVRMPVTLSAKATKKLLELYPKETDRDVVLRWALFEGMWQMLLKEVDFWHDAAKREAKKRDALPRTKFIMKHKGKEL